MPVRNWITAAVAILTIATAALSFKYTARAAGGADSYGYVSQADAWISGSVPRPQRFLESQTDRPVTQWIFAPLGWKPSKTSSDLVPTYAPGYPMLLALAKAAFGHAALFWVVPLFAGALVWSTYVLGCRLNRPGSGAVAALLVASSATVLYMSMVPMSDVPSAALWTMALAAALGRTKRSALCAGAAAAVAILVRPNLLPIAGFIGAWMLANDVRQHRARVWRGRAGLFAAIAAIGVLWLAALNNQWYGSPAESGYGDLGGLFNVRHVAGNVRHYATSLVRAETPLSLVGLCLILAAPGFVNRRRDVVGVPLLLFAIVAWIWGTYLLYLVYDAWWFLRFLLPAFPLMALGSASAAAWLFERRGASRIAAVAAIAVTVAATTWFAWRENAFSIGLTESRYPQVARAVAALTGEQSIVITLQHSGTVRYYGGRMTARWEVIFPREFGAMVAWFRAHDHHPYLLADRGEMPELVQRFGHDPAFAPATTRALGNFFDGETQLFDLAPDGPAAPFELRAYSRQAFEPAAPPKWDR